MKPIDKALAVRKGAGSLFTSILSLFPLHLEIKRDPTSFCRVCLLFLLGLCSLSGCDVRNLMEIEIGSTKAVVELASDPEARRKGLMGRTQLGQDQGMLMVYPSPSILDIWMLNTAIPLDVGFFDAQGRLVNIASMLPDGGKQIYTSMLPSVYALEMNMGWFARHGLKPGVKLQLPYSVQAR